MDYVASKAHVAQRSQIEEQAIFSFPFCLFVIFVVVVVIVVLLLRRVGACFGGALGVNHRSARKKKTKYTHKNERGSHLATVQETINFLISTSTQYMEQFFVLFCFLFLIFTIQYNSQQLNHRMEMIVVSKVLQVATFFSSLIWKCD